MNFLNKMFCLLLPLLKNILLLVMVNNSYSQKKILFLFHFIIYHLKNVYLNRSDEVDNYYQAQFNYIKEINSLIPFLILCMIV